MAADGTLRTPKSKEIRRRNEADKQLPTVLPSRVGVRPSSLERSPSHPSRLKNVPPSVQRITAPRERLKPEAALDQAKQPGPAVQQARTSAHPGPHGRKTTGPRVQPRALAQAQAANPARPRESLSQTGRRLAGPSAPGRPPAEPTGISPPAEATAISPPVAAPMDPSPARAAISRPSQASRSRKASNGRPTSVPQWIAPRCASRDNSARR